MIRETHDAPTTAGAKIDQHSTIGGMLWIGFYTSILSILTLTLFRFWGRTQFRRRLWKETVIDGEPLEYVGKGSELFFGFLIAIFTVMAPMVGALLFAQLAMQPPASFVVIFAVYLMFYVLIFAALFLTRRYQLSRTLWRGVRFAQEGQPLAFALSAFGQALLTIITFGWFAPKMRLNLAEWMWSRTKFGDLGFAYDSSPQARTEKVWASFALAWLGSIVFYLAFIGAVFAIMSASGGNPGPMQFVQMYAAALALIIPLLLMTAWHEAVMLRQITKSISLGEVSFRVHVGAWDVLLLVFTNALLVIFTLGFGAMAAEMRSWRFVARRLELAGQLNYSAIGQAASRGPRTGEGMADAFDLSGGV
ncbi:MAG: DUF898 family protein [Alphaproteobacteria bacterium]|nr:DUF898 family protein [Alphaproteobacteria bacterium]